MHSSGKSSASFLAAVFIMSFIIIQTTLVSAQSSNNTSPPATQWQKTFGSQFTATLSNLIQTSDGGYAFLECGSIGQSGMFIPSILYKLDSYGNMQWNKTFNLFSASNIIQTSDGGYEIAGTQAYGITFQPAPTLIKLNSKGDTQWRENTTTILDLANVTTNIRTSDGGFTYFKGGITTNVAPFGTPAFIKIDSSNETQWILNLPYSGPANYDNGTIDFPFKISSIIETSDGALAGLGIADSELNAGVGFIYLIKTAPFLPSPSQSPLPTPLPSPTPAPFTITVNEQILIIAFIAVVVALNIGLLIYRRHHKTSKTNTPTFSLG